MTEEKKQMLNEKDLKEVSGGGWGYHTYHNEGEYNAIGIETDWTGWYNPFRSDRFTYKGKSITKETAAAMVFYFRKDQDLLDTPEATIHAALNFKASRLAEFQKDVAGANAN